jgi:myo-inositol catabolism protein IolC
MSTDSPLFLLALDHRSGLVRGMLPGQETRAGELLPDAKRLIYEGAAAGLAQADGQGGGRDASASRGVATAGRGRPGVLVDEQYGADVARLAKADGWASAVAIEASGQDEFELEYGDEAAAHIDALAPDYAKVLVRYNPGSDAGSNARQRETLAEVSELVARSSSELLFELLVPPTTAQLDSVSGDRDRYDAELRAELTCQTIDDFRAAGVVAPMWKLEGLETVAESEAVAARTGGAPCIVLGRNAPQERVEHWLSVAAAADGWEGFAIGRSIWWNAVSAWIHEGLPRETAIRDIADGYARVIEVYRAAEAAAVA